MMTVTHGDRSIALLDDLLARTEGRRIDALQALPAKRQDELGQFFTPDRAAALIASQFTLPDGPRIRILDPGAGSGSLSIALATRIMTERPLTAIEIVAVEIDAATSLHLRNTLMDLRETAADLGHDVSTTVIEDDFIAACTGFLHNEADLGDKFDLIIMNPPYRKLPASSAHRKSLIAFGVDCPNLYAAFLALSIDLLASFGQLVAITPRSFANGPYFSQFRAYILERVALTRIHTFESRSAVFADTGVLQENIVLTASRGGRPGMVALSTSVGHSDDVVTRVVESDQVVRPDDPHRFIRILSNESDTAVAERMASLPATLVDLRIKVSTGKVVDFRAKDRLLPALTDDSVPLIYPGNIRGGIVEWPRKIRKNQAFKIGEPDDSRKYLLPAGYYVVVKRFSAKEERRRVVAAVWNPDTYAAEVAFENHVNVYHGGAVGLEKCVAVGLSYWLNSSIVDSFFRTFSGHTQVNATDLRSLSYPSLDTLRDIGTARNMMLPEQSIIDDIISRAIDCSSDGEI